MQWGIYLSPREAGEITIPALTVTSGEGTFTTQPITLQVSTEQVQHKKTDAGEIQIRIETGNTSPYVLEPFLYSIFVTISGEVIDVQMDDKPEADGARIDKAGNLEARQFFRNGQQIMETRSDYLVTPLRDGSITLHPVELKGKILSLSSQLNAPSNMLHGLLSFMQADSFEPFTAFSEKATYTIKPAQAGIDPWLPLSGMDIIDESESIPSTIAIGEPLQRTLSIHVTGNHESVIPSLLSLYENAIKNSGIKIYGGKPETHSRYDKATGLLQAERRETLTFVPEKGGELTIPAITLNWWNVDLDKAESSTIPAITFNVSGSASPNRPQQHTSQPISSTEPETSNTTTRSEENAYDNAPSLPPLWTFIIPLLSLIAGLGFQSYRHRNNIASTLRNLKSRKPSSQKNAKAQLMHASNITEMHRFALQLLDSGSTNALPASLTATAQKFCQPLDKNKDIAAFINHCRSLESALYGGRTCDINEWRASFLQQYTSLLELRKQYTSRRKHANVAALPPLNPA